MTNDLPVEPDEVPGRPSMSGDGDAAGAGGPPAGDAPAVGGPAPAAAAMGPPAVGEVVGTDAETSPAADAFPRERFVGLVGRLPRYLRLAWGLAGEPRLSRRGRAGVLAAAAYLASPIDAIPGVIPVVGQVDDLAVTLLALRAALRALDPATRERQLAAAGLAPDDLDRDLATLGVIAAWLARRGFAIGRRLGGLALAASVAVARTGVGVVRQGAPAVARTGVGVVRAAGGAARAGVGAVAGATGRGIGGFRVRVLRRGPGAGPTDDATGEADLDAGAGI